MDFPTYSALNRLILTTNYSTNYKNFAYTTGNSIDSKDCTSFQTLLPVWPNNHNNVTWDACVNITSRSAMQPEQTNKATSPPKAPASTLTAAIAVSFVALIAIALYALYRRRVHRLRQQWDATDELMDDLEVLSPVRIPMNDVTLFSKMNEGAFGEIYRGQYLGRVVAVKKLLPQKTAILDIQSFIDELQIMARFDCARIVALYGVAWTRPRDITAVIELMDLGDLKEFLSIHRLVPWTRKLQIIRDIVEALVYIHSMSIIHRDMKSRNVLLDSTKGAKITDFGVSKEDFQETMTISVGTYRWMAPEILKDDHYTIAADIFSLGMIMSEIDTHEIPYAQTVNPKTGRAYVDTAIVSMVINGTIQPSFTPTCPPWLKSLALRCLSHEPEARPTAIELDFALSNIAMPDEDAQ
ncbi:kinase [Thraustotheca clavata]|uniref:Kinase n=1 Tax=Thraustotheca clavata TaxID=74557 RepID=A0A1W0AC76_9STRA|nr:kinase [Thraustotheca clavata]